MKLFPKKVEDLWEAIKQNEINPATMLKVEYEGEIFYGVFMQTCPAPEDKINVHIHLARPVNSFERAFDLETSTITILSAYDAVKELNLSIGSIGQAQHADDKHGITKGALDKKWWEEQTGQRLP